ncbi:MAG TPA: DUF177 domain-containing protein [Bacteroidales bacterium]|nr:DUF177 domain-containing protein [Bacteroidales bacterium]
MSRKYTIPLSGMKDGLHQVEFEIDNRFFERFEESEVKEGSLTAEVVIEKRSTHSDLTIRISGAVMICCDRCLEMFSFPVESKSRLLVKFGENDEEIDPDILYLAFGENELDLQQHFYDFIMLSLPIRKIHPDDIEGNSTCDPEMLKKLEDLITEGESETDPRWDDLKKLMNNN